MATGFRKAVLVGLITVAPSLPAWAGYSFNSIDGGQIDLDSFSGKPVLVVNTASLCGFAPQFTELQELQDKYKAQGLVVLAVPSNDFNQELESGQAAAEYCQANFDITLPMTDITPVLGDGAHPFYRWLADEHDFVPSWNFNKVLLDGQGQVVDTWGSMTSPMSGKIVDQVETLLN